MCKHIMSRWKQQVTLTLIVTKFPKNVCVFLNDKRFSLLQALILGV